MMRVSIVCEGQTEVEFVKNCLAEYLLDSKILATPVVLQAPSGKHRGGRVTIERLVNFIKCECYNADGVTTLVDYYGFQDRGNRSRSELEAAILNGFIVERPKYDTRFILPYVQMYEFEGLLFSDPKAFDWVQDGWNDRTCEALIQVRETFQSPEDINGDPATAPSNRIMKIFGKGIYSKVEHGPLIAETIGIEAIRSQCPQFSDWLQTLQSWGALYE